MKDLCDDDDLDFEEIDDSEFDDDDDLDWIDWDEIIATTQPDFEAGRFAFNSADYPTHEEAMVALEQLFDEIVEEVRREISGIPPSDAASNR